MEQETKAGFRQELDSFSVRLDQARKRWQQGGSLDEKQKRDIEEIEAKHGLLHHKAAAQEEPVWRTLAGEFRQAFSTVIKDFERLSDQLDHEKDTRG